MNKHPKEIGTFREVEHELEHLKKREQVSSALAIASTVLAMIALAGVLGAGHIIFGALVAVALVAALYAYCCRQAESYLRNKRDNWIHEGAFKDHPRGTISKPTEAASTGLLNYFSQTK